eukprot:4484008-Prymnesium_polylepis.1
MPSRHAITPINVVEALRITARLDGLTVNSGGAGGAVLRVNLELARYRIPRTVAAQDCVRRTDVSRIDDMLRVKFILPEDTLRESRRPEPLPKLDLGFPAPLGTLPLTSTRCLSSRIVSPSLCPIITTSSSYWTRAGESWGIKSGCRRVGIGTTPQPRLFASVCANVG